MRKKKKHVIKTETPQTKNGQGISPIDYEKLSSAIAKAIAEETNHHAEKYSVTREWMKFIICPVLYLIAVLSGILGIGFFVAELKLLRSFGGAVTTMGFGQVIIFLFLSFLLIGVAMFTFFAAKELNEEKDRSFVVAVFSGTVSLVALIISLIAFFMEITF